MMDLRALQDSAPDLRGGGFRPADPLAEVHIDGDYCAYYFAGNDDTEPSTARENFVSLANMVARVAGADHGVIHITAASSDKGRRYEIATVKPYPGNRDGGRKPKNWQVMRDFMERNAGAKLPGTGLVVKSWEDREADDGVAYAAARAIARGTVPFLYYRDKDFRSIPGMHITWNEFEVVDLMDDPFSRSVHGLQYGHLWFWMQMLMGDSADNVPGLPGVPKAKGDGFKACGEACAASLLEGAGSDKEAAARVLAAYTRFYGDAAAEAIAEQARLLWMRRDAKADLDNWRSVLDTGGIL